MKPAIYDTMSLTIEVAENGLVITSAVTSSEGFYTPDQEKKHIASSNTQAATIANRLAAEGIAKLGTDVPTDNL